MTQETAPLVFVREDWRLFLNLSTLGQKAGVARHLIGALVIKELVDNALDAGAHVEVKEMDGGWMAVEDDGPGIDPDKIASLFSVNRPLTSTKLLRRPLRGALGNGLRVVVGAVYASGGQLRIRTRGKWATVLPEASGESTVHLDEAGLTIGTRIEIKLGADVKVSSSLAGLSLAMNKGSLYKGLTSPHWYDSHAFRELLHAGTGWPMTSWPRIIKDCTAMTAPHIGHGKGEDMKEKLKDRKTSEGVAYAQMNLKYPIFILPILKKDTEIHIAKIVKRAE